jgi:hypothetical protein
MANGEWSKLIMTAETSSKSDYYYSLRFQSDYYYSLRFQVSSGEVRPRNQAIRIWKKVQ